MTTISGSTHLNVFSSSICRYNNGSDICDLGHKLTYPGFCFSQSLGKMSSTGFEPEYLPCFTEYVSVLDSTNNVVAVSGGTLGLTTLLSFLSGSVSGTSFPLYTPDVTITNKTNQLGYDNGTSASAQLVSSTTSLIGAVKGSDYLQGTSSRFTIFHAGKNIVKHLENRGSPYWVVDTYAEASILKRWPQKESVVHPFSVAKTSGFSYINSSNTSLSGVSLPYKAIQGDISLPLGGTLASGEEGSNPVSFCVDDLTAPYVNGQVPSAFSLLNDESSYVMFDVGDSVGGVDIGVLSVTVSSDKTVQPEGSLVVSSGTDQTGGHVSITGDSVKYTVLYTPSLNWQPNEKVTVRVTGQDVEPLYQGAVWSCVSSGTRNLFDVTYWYKVKTESNLSASIVAIPDTTGPVVENAVPAASSSDNISEAGVQFDIVDDTFTVNLVTLNVSVNGTELISAGKVVDSSTVVQAVAKGYRVIYTHNFSYGSTVTVEVSAYDTAPIPNIGTITYTFDIVSDASLVIDSFSFLPDVSYNAETKILSVDVYDLSNGISQCYFIVDGVSGLGTKTAITGGYHLEYTPSDYWKEHGLAVSVYGLNGNATSPVHKTKNYVLYSGYKLISSKQAFREDQSYMRVAARAVNTDTIANRLSELYKVALYEPPVSDLAASITAIVPWSNFFAAVEAISPTHAYGKEVVFELYIEDKDSNSFGPYSITYKIEERP